MIKMNFIMFMLIMMIGTMITCSANSWLTCWIGLEINLMCFIPMLTIKLSPISSESTIKYFLIQAAASVIIIIFSMIMFMNSYFEEMMFFSEMIFLSLTLKAGVPPLHFWFPKIVELCFWFQIFILITWQKVAPMFLLSMFNSNFLNLIIVSSAIIGGLGAFNLTSIKKIMAFSSISNSAWILACLPIKFLTSLLFFLIYCMIVMNILLFCMENKINFINSMNFKIKNLFNKKMFIFSMLTLAGLPPFIGFLGKMMIIQELFFFKSSFFIILILIISSLLTLFFYLKVIYSTFLLKSYKIYIMSCKESMIYFKFNEMFMVFMMFLSPILLVL